MRSVVQIVLEFCLKPLTKLPAYANLKTSFDKHKKPRTKSSDTLTIQPIAHDLQK